MNGNVLLQIVLFALLSSFVKSERYNQTTMMMNYLFGEERYDKRLRPGLNENSIVMVKTAMTIVHFGQVREKEMDFSLDIFFYQEWYDQRLAHSLPYPIYLSGNHYKLIWMPDTFFLNIKTAKTHNVPSDNTKVTVKSDGLVRYSTRLTLTAGCEMNLLDYPLDKQKCNLTILSYSYPIEDLDYEWAGNAEETVEIMNKAMNEFNLESIELEKENYKYKIGNWTHLNIMFTFQRRIGYSLLQVYAPILLIVTLSWLSFWISKDAAPARIALGITTVLTIVTLMGSLRSEFPKVSYVKAIDLFFIVSFMFVFGAVMEYILVLLNSAMEEKTEKDKEARHKHFAQQMKNEYLQSSSFNEGQANGRDISTEEGIEACNNGKEQSTSENPQARQRKGMPGRTIEKTKNVVRFVLIEHDAHVVDRVSRAVFPLGYLIFNIIYWLYYSLGSFY